MNVCGSPADCLIFWQGVATHNNFKNVASCALTCLIAPTSNAIVERIFSLVTAFKTKPRKKTQIKLLDTLVGILSHLLSNAICCKHFECKSSMIRLPNSVDLCGQNESSSIKAEYLEGILH